MKASELTKANIGDTIVLRGTVRDVDGSNMPVEFIPGEGPDSVWLHSETEVEIVERPFKVGDEVLCCGDPDPCIIRAIEDEEVWVRRCRDQSRFTARISVLKRVTP